MIGSWRLAMRIAVRDARRTRGRSILVIVLLGLPVLAVAVGSTLMHSFDTTPSAQAVRDMGAADAMIAWEHDEPIGQEPIGTRTVWPESDDSEFGTADHSGDEILAELPPGSRLVEITDSTGTVSTADRPDLDDGAVGWIGLDLADPMTDGMVTLLDGQNPGAGEIAISEAAADAWDVRTGDRLHLDEPDITVTVSGLVELPDSINKRVVIGAPDLVGGRHRAWLADTPHPVTWDDVRQYNALGMAVYSRTVAADPPPTPDGPYAVASGLDVEQVIMVTFLIGMVGLEIVLLAGPAFAISAKRRAREFALLGANGATPAQIRRIVLASGIVLGGAAAVGSLLLGAGLSVAAIPIAENIVGQRVAEIRVWPQIMVPAAVVAVVTGLLAAVVPAFTVARQHIVTALTGRRGTVRSRKRWVALGLAMVAAGIACGWFGAGETTPTLLLTGVILGELGLVLCTPALVGLISRFGAILPLSPRIALRDAGRNRSSAAPAISAVMAVVAGGLALTMFYVADDNRYSQQTGNAAPQGTVAADIWQYYEEPESSNAGAVSDTAETVAKLMTDTMPVSATYLIPRLDCVSPSGDSWCETTIVPPDSTACPYDDKIGELSPDDQAKAAGNRYCKQRVSAGQGTYSTGNFLVDEAALAAITGADSADVAAASKVLDAGGVVVNDPDLLTGDSISVEVRNFTDNAPEGDLQTTETLPGYALSTGTLNREQVLYSADAAQRLGISGDSDITVFGDTSRTPDRAERRAFDKALAAAGWGSNDSMDDGDISVFWEVADPMETPKNQQLVLLLLAGISGFLALAATAVATALAAAESRRDLATLAAIGASPGVRRKLSLFQAGVISLLGAVLGVAAGGGACYAAIVALNAQLAVAYPRENPYLLTPPWLNIGVALLMVPLIAMAGAGLLTRSRLPSERRPAG